MSESKIGKLEEESLKRKERLKKLRNIPSKSTSNDDENQNAKAGEELPKPAFRSYKPNDENLGENITPEGPNVEIEDEIKDQLELLKIPVVMDDIDIASIAPRKPDWDLKRDVAKKLDKLERRTQKAIAELIRERLKKNEENIFQAVNVGTEFSSKERKS